MKTKKRRSIKKLWGLKQYSGTTATPTVQNTEEVMNDETTSLEEKRSTIPIPGIEIKGEILVTTYAAFWDRVWYFISNPFRYLISGKLIY